MPYDCIGIEGGVWSSGCVVTCPGGCTVTPNVASPCGFWEPDDDDDDDMDMDPTSGSKGTKSIALASMMIGAVVANTLL